MEFPILQTERLILREWQVSDALDLYNIFMNDSVLQYTGIPVFSSDNDALRRIENSRIYFHEKIRGITWGAYDCESGKVIGDVELNFNAKHFRAELACSFAPKAWGKGFAFEAMKEIVRYAFDEFPLFKMNRLEAYVDPQNTSARKLIEKLGFKNEALLNEYYFERGKLVDQHIYGLVRKEWKVI